MNATPIRKLAVSLGVALGVLAGCDIFSSDKKEFPKADNDIVAGETVKGTLPSTGLKPITFVADSGNTYVIRCNSEEGYLNMTVMGPDSSMANTRSYTSGSNDWEDSVVVAVSKTGTYTIMVSGTGSIDYTVELNRTGGYPSWYVVADGYESDNTLHTAKSIATDSTVQHRTLYTQGGIGYDYDWISMKCDSGKTYTVHVEGISGSSYYAIYKADSTTMNSISNSTYNSSTSEYTYTREFAVSKSGTYYVRLYSSYSNYSYSIAVTAVNGISETLVGDKYEVDNTLSSAKALSTDSTVQSRSLHYDGNTYDIDWISIKCDSGKTYTVHVNGISSSYFAIYKGDSTYLSTSYSSTYNSSTSSYIYTRSFGDAKSGTYYVRVYDGSYDGSSYRIAATAENGISSTLVGDVFEADNSIATAKTIPSDSTIQKRTLHYDGSYDIDWVAIKCDSGKTYTVHQTGLGSSYFSIYKADSTYISTTYSSTYNSSTSTYTYSRSFGVAKSGTYYVRIYYGSSSLMSYTLAATAANGISSSIVGDRFETDNSLSTAKTIPADSTVQNRTLHYDGSYDIDWIAIKCDSGKTYTVYEEGLGSSYFSIYKGDSSYLSTSYNSAYNSSSGNYIYSRSFGVAKSGTYYVYVGNSSSSLTNYSIAVTAVNGISSSLIGDKYEDDNTIGTAKAITTDSSIQSRSLHYDGSYDIDWISIKCDSGKTYNVYETGVGSSYFTIYGPDSLSLSTTATSTYNSSTSNYTYNRKFGVTKSGTYYVRVYYGNSSTTNYTIAVVAKSGLDVTLVGDAFESDNTLGTAKSIKTDSTIQNRSFHTSSTSSYDYDWISFKADSGHTYKYYSNYSVTPNFYGPDSLSRQSMYIGSTYNSNTGTYTYKTVFPVTKSGTYYVRLYSSTAMEYWAAMVDSSGLPQWAKPDAGEPDHGLSSAMSTTADSSVLYRSLNGNDTDWVRIPVQKNRVYSIRLDNDASTSSYTTITANLLDSTNSSLYYTTLYYGDYLTTSYLATKDGSIWVRLLPYNYSSTTTIPYSVQVSSASLPADIREPDQRLGTAAAIPTDSLPINRWVGYNDSDWMSFDVDSGRKVNVIVGIPSTSTTSTTVYYRLFSRDSILVNNSSIYSIGYTSQITYTPRYKGKMYLQVFNAYTNIVTPYTVQIENYPIDSTEPDDGIATARSVPTDSSATARILGGTNADWVKFPVTAGRIYQFNLTGEASTYMVLSNPDSTTATFVSGSYTSTSSPSYYEATTSKTMYLRLTNYSTTTANSVRLRISSFANDSDEPANSTTAGARTLRTDSVAARGYLSGSDQDFYEVMLDSGSTYLFNYTTDNNVYAYMALLTTESSSSYVFSSTTSSQAYTALKTGKHYLRMTAYTSTAVARYTVTASKIVNDTFELDNTRLSAKPIEVGGATQSRILTKNDVDWISVAVDSGVNYTLYTKSSDMLYVTIYTDDDLVKYSSVSVSSGIERVAQTFIMGRKCNLYIKLTPYYTSTISNPYTARVVKN